MQIGFASLVNYTEHRFVVGPMHAGFKGVGLELDRIERVHDTRAVLNLLNNGAQSSARYSLNFHQK